MMGIRYLKAAPTTYVIHYQGGRVKREGAGLSFLYWGPTSTLVSIPLASMDVPFVFNEMTSDFQAVTLQGQLTYRVVDPHRLASLLDYTIGPDGAYRSDDPGVLRERLIHAAQLLAREVTQSLKLREVLTSSEKLAARVLPALRAERAVTLMGVDVLQLTILSLKPTPEMGKALEAEAREDLHRNADEAIYARRNAAVEQERKIKESELQTEVAVEEKRRQIRETQMAAEIAVEDQRAALVERRVQNERKEADIRAYALEGILNQVRTVDWRTLMTIGSGGIDPKAMIALAFQNLAENAQKIGELNVTPDLLKSLLGSKDR
ncbi:MAG TPA: SPFH domain-containing protein [Candidatus Polarisedimenticolaceae bacterium]|nr:SPFH domain-containing protein [Candidatus Polarisedimenticolaceae bacterium]